MRLRISGTKTFRDSCESIMERVSVEFDFVFRNKIAEPVLAVSMCVNMKIIKNSLRRHLIASAAEDFCERTLIVEEPHFSTPYIGCSFISWWYLLRVANFWTTILISMNFSMSTQILGRIYFSASGVHWTFNIEWKGRIGGTMKLRWELTETSLRSCEGHLLLTLRFWPLQFRSIIKLQTATSRWRNNCLEW